MQKFGLTTQQAEQSKQLHGDNTITQLKGETFWQKLLHNFGDPMIKILCVALILNLIFLFLGHGEWYEAVGIAIAVLLATLVSTFSEHRNESAFQKLQDEASKISCKVYRNGNVCSIPIDDIVIGDAVILNAGDKIPADGVLLQGEIKVDQSVLNGESKEATKKTPPQNQPNLNQSQSGEQSLFDEFKLFRGTVVCSGDSVLEVTNIGDKTVYGQIAKELQEKDDRDSPLKVKLTGLAKKISTFAYIGGVIIALLFIFLTVVVQNNIDPVLIGKYLTGDFTVVFKDITDAVMLAVVIIVMAVPEGLPLMISLVSALNMKKMLKDNVLVRKIVGIETAGSLNLLFSDKTGTITKGKLEIVSFIDGEINQRQKLTDTSTPLSNLIYTSLAYNTNAYLNDKGEAVGGNGTERATVSYIKGITTTSKFEKVHSIPFNSDNKFSATQIKGDINTTLIKGAPEKLLNSCSFYYDENLNKKPLDKAKIEAQINQLANRAIRVIALATVDCDLTDDILSNPNFTLVGILGIRDDVREESVVAIKEVQSAGVQVIMITGDRKDTATAIAKEAGIIQKDSDIILTSADLATMSDDEIKAKLKDIRVIARALPSDKSRLVKISQSLDLVVGMTGDGVNDSPALKKSDVGFGMGSGTEVAKEASDIVILDDNFSSIDKAILYGRTIFNSIRKFIVFQLTINVSAVLISIIAPLFGVESPLTIMQILWINLVMDTLAALAFGGEAALKRYMKEKPKSRKESIVSVNMWSSIITSSVWILLLSVFLLFSDYSRSFLGFDSTLPIHDNKTFFTAFFTFFVFAAIFNSFCARTDSINLFQSILRNKNFLSVIGIIVAIQVAMCYLGGPLFASYGLNLNEWLFILILAFSVIPVDLVRKSIVKLFNRKAKA